MDILIRFLFFFFFYFSMDIVCFFFHENKGGGGGNFGAKILIRGTKCSTDIRGNSEEKGELGMMGTRCVCGTERKYGRGKPELY